jgi:hypothetical protein
MSAVKRRVFNALAAVSLVLCVQSVVGWLLALFVYHDQVFFPFRGRPFYQLFIEVTYRGDIWIGHWPARQVLVRSSYVSFGTMVLPLIKVAERDWNRLRERRWRRALLARLCPQCGYDLRATPDRCPECGTAVGPVARAVPPRDLAR